MRRRAHMLTYSRNNNDGDDDYFMFTSSKMKLLY